MGSIGFYMMTVLLGSSAAFGLLHKDQPRPGLSSGSRKMLVFLAGVFVVCVLLMVTVAFISSNSSIAQ